MFKILSIESSKEPWLETARESYAEKIKHFFPFSVELIKSRKVSGTQRELKIQHETDDLLKKLKSQDFVILCDEKGKNLESRALAKSIQGWIDGGRKSMVFIIGGAYGVDERLQKRAQVLLKLSDFTMNHHVAQLVLLEQIYRSFTILKNLPYHHD